MNNLLFDERSSIFIVASPFQLLCAIEAIKRFGIEEPLFVLLLNGGTRDKQLLETATFFKVPYKSFVYRDRYSLLKFLWRYRIPMQEIVFIGDYRAMIMKVFAALLLKRKGKIVFLDDGNATLWYFYGKRKIDNNFKIIFYKTLCLLKGISLKENFFSIFYKNLRNRKINCMENDFRYLVELNRKKRIDNTIIVIGTNVKAYCMELRINFDEYRCYVEELFEFFSKNYKTHNVKYIQHGNDESTFQAELCKNYGFEWIRPKMCVELYIQNLDALPFACFAYTSTALITIQKLFPTISCYNIICNTNLSAEYLDICAYLKDNGIITLNHANNLAEEMWDIK